MYLFEIFFSNFKATLKEGGITFEGITELKIIYLSFGIDISHTLEFRELIFPFN